MKHIHRKEVKARMDLEKKSRPKKREFSISIDIPPVFQYMLLLAVVMIPMMFLLDRAGEKDAENAYLTEMAQITNEPMTVSAWKHKTNMGGNIKRMIQKSETGIAYRVMYDEGKNDILKVEKKTKNDYITIYQPEQD